MIAQYRKICGTLSLVVANFILSSSSFAATYFADAGVLMKRMEFNAKSSNGLTDYSLKPIFASLSVSASMVGDGYYLTANIDNSLVDSKINDTVYVGDEDSLSRADRSITVGYNLAQRASIFLGYLNGETKDEYSFPVNNETGTITFSEKGLFIGANYLYVIGESALGLNIAFASLNGEYNNTYKTNATTGERNYSGDTTGFSLGAKYIAKKWSNGNSAYLGCKINLFNFKSPEFDTKENFYVLQAGLTHRY